MYMNILKQKEEVDRQKLRAYGLDLFSLKFKKKIAKGIIFKSSYIYPNSLLFSQDILTST